MSVPYPDALIADLALETSNSYCDVEYADSYFANHFSTVKQTAWAALSEGQKTQALIQSCWTIEQLRFTVLTDYTTQRLSDLRYNSTTGKFTAYVSPTFESAKYNFYQALQFPRNKDVLTSGALYMPDRVMKAQCEQAIYLTTFDDSAISNALQGISLDSIQVDKIKLTQEYTNGVRGSTLAPLALDYLKPYIIFGLRIKRS